MHSSVWEGLRCSVPLELNQSRPHPLESSSFACSTGLSTSTQEQSPKQGDQDVVYLTVILCSPLCEAQTRPTNKYPSLERLHIDNDSQLWIAFWDPVIASIVQPSALNRCLPYLETQVPREGKGGRQQLWRMIKQSFKKISILWAVQWDPLWILGSPPPHPYIAVEF